MKTTEKYVRAIISCEVNRYFNIKYIVTITGSFAKEAISENMTSLGCSCTNVR